MIARQFDHRTNSTHDTRYMTSYGLSGDVQGTHTQPSV